MKLGGLQPFIVEQIQKLGLKEWRDGFNTANIPANVINGSFHVLVGAVAAGKADQGLHNFSVPITVRIFFKGYRYPSEAINAGLDKAQDVMAALLRPSVRVGNQSELKDIRPVSIQPLPLDASNDNSVLIELVFTGFLNYRFQ